MPQCSPYNNSVFIFYFQYNIKKKEELVEQQPQDEPNPLMRKKKTPEELAAEAEQEDLDDFTSKYFKLISYITIIHVLGHLGNKLFYDYSVKFAP